ncbi:DUF5069 domain-containing protein [Verrucomicrobia bacterium LW23]|nr:DUF5069 domain-containing protein [Verrucomicrobia bacterium LW23]
MKTPGLRSPYEMAGGIVYFPRMLDKIRLHAAGQLPPDYVENLGKGFDGRCCAFLGISYEALRDHVLHATGEETGDEAIATWAAEHGRNPSETDKEVWNGFMTKRGWRDSSTGWLRFRIHEAGRPVDGSILTMFDFIDADEENPPRTFAAVTDPSL